MKDVIVIDIETTGLPRMRNAPYRLTKVFDDCRLVSIAAIRWDMSDRSNPQITDKLHSIIYPDGYIVNGYSIHKISQSRALKEGRKLQSVMDDMMKIIKPGDIFASYNTEFDKTVLLSELFRNNMSVECGVLESHEWMCVMKETSKFLGTERWIKLSVALDTLFPNDIHKTKNLHDAMFDAQSASRVLFHIFNTQHMS
jgi:DNA polymerase III epsilon subunit-like protein